VLGNAIWEALKYFLKPVLAAAIAAFLALLPAVKRLRPSTNWSEAMITAALLALAIVLPLLVIAVSARALPARWTMTMEKLAVLVRQGRELRNSVQRDLHTGEQLNEWVNQVDKWMGDAQRFLSHCTAQAEEKFLDDSVTAPSYYSGSSFPGSETKMRELNQRLRNLGSIMERPEVYL
jgi:predicted PurR-regulated permease PerM